MESEQETTLKIMIVDDDKFLLDMYSMKFKKSGLEITTAFNGLSALEKLRLGRLTASVSKDAKKDEMREEKHLLPD